MYKIVKFLPQNFGGYTFFMLMAGVFTGYTGKSFWWFVPSIISFFIAVWFYAKDNYEEEE